MEGLNRFQFICRVAADIELRYSPNGTAVVELECTIHKFVRGGGQKPVVVKVKLFGENAENVKHYCVKDSRIYIEGEISVDEWSDKQTQQPRSKMVLNGNQITFLDRRGEASSSASPSPAAPPKPKSPFPGSKTPPPAQPELPASKEEDNVPF